jgi:LPS-assembly protein
VIDVRKLRIRNRAKSNRNILWKILFCAALTAVVLTATPVHAIVKKPFVAPISTSPIKGTKVDVEADRVTYDPKSKVATATGKVILVYGPYHLVATKVEYNQITGAFKANGSVELREPNGNILQATKLSLTDKFAKGFALHIRALLTNDATISADYAKRIDGDITIFDHVKYTACRLDVLSGKPPVWEIVTDQTTHDQGTHDLYHINPKLKIAGTTVLSLPYWSQPDPTVRRRTGWLAPQFKFGSTYGAGVALPYFLALAPNYDLTVTPLVTTKLNLAADIDWRHRLESGSYSVHAYGAYQTQPNNNGIDNQALRGAFKTKGDFKINNDWKWGWQATYASDRAFLNHYDYDPTIIANNDMHLTGLWDQTYVSAQLLDFESLSTNVSQDRMPYALPFINGEKIIPNALLGGDLKLDWNIYALHRQDQYTPFTGVNHGTTQTRATSSVEWKTQLIADSGFVVTPFAKLRSDLYMTENLPDPAVLGGIRGTETTTRLLPTVGVDMRFPMIANFEDGQSIITPVFQFISAANEKSEDKIGNEDAIAVDYDTNSIFLTDRFTGLDRFESGTRANVGLTYSYAGNTGNYVRASLGESVHLAGKNSFMTGSGLNGTQSDLVGSVVFQPFEHLTLSYEARVEEDLSKVNRQEATAGLNFDSFSANISYLNFGAEPLYGRTLAENWLASDVRVKMDENWYGFGGLTYDFYNGSLTRKTIGLEYDCDCANFKLAYSSTQDPIAATNSNSLMLSVELATLGGTSVTGKF